ncbi:ankyrin repeat and SOCS box protein 15 isoform X1 [Callorhinchus milii]|uniref:Ankyrin repeat and SOCS box containing 15 n=2 Tax=Callorhinchus milii TaxID=7868 RepID=A0A4W3K8N7_CALMI|nr:ankyrin repeat and SOCS box protein 15 isoform X1 [Callorhinchus milii]XP_007896751.1 ankyrin repeat and SOCS box protein 15 isoform X1 [Callorhinchus milii]XP_007896752.1 ankyrin repeat and SOCS box protein 15 isoform X1 [Callorhinchus milii]XP_007896754.1 ankyrin repeat and SOCS box protein 15 isoform X1 [Callorhinchus milii]XP_007896755.1 ankyrin repeat and SOCS box protein 15 isoform X1 [Callorhinchus milii]XP_007896756.1 ankyrin repeat and SOCS box protein 15 isoform X1 [Callorhinchus |eukprot:gi/632961426/ref/XP_007896750.1/ PREDICTED: ankyrin repeat and SOCS box protein 15 isoform X1 [Callorhinchus milii]
MDGISDSVEDHLTQYAIQLSIQEPSEARGSERFLPPSQENRKIVEAIRQGEIFQLQQINHWTFAFNEADERGWCPLHEAAIQPHQQIMEIVLDSSYKSTWEQRTQEGDTALTLAVTAGVLGNVRALLEKSICPNTTNNRGETPLLIAVRRNAVELVSVLLEHGAHPNRPCVRRWTAMHEAAKHGRKEIAALLLRHQSNVNQKDGYGVTPVATAAGFGHCSVMEHLIHKGGNVHAKTDDGATVLFEAAEGGNPDCITVLLEYGANPNIPDNSGLLPIHRAAQQGHYLALKHLVGVTLQSAVRRSGRSPLHSAAEGGSAQCLELLIDSGFDVNVALDEDVSESYSDKRRSALFFSVSNSDVTCARLLLEAGARPDADPLPCLLVAVRASSHELVRLLLQHGANPNCHCLLVTDTQFPSAIQYAVNDHIMLRLLLNNGYKAHMCFNCIHSGSSLPWPTIEPQSRIVSFCEFITVPWMSHLIGRVVRVLIDYVDCISLCETLRSALEKQNEWPEIQNILENPSGLKHLCRLMIRKCVGQSRLQSSVLLPFPPLLRHYILYKDYDLYGRGLTS